jgi:hypothetical protein
MSTVSSAHGIVNGHWEPSRPEPPKVVVAIRSGVAKLMKTIHPRSEAPAHISRADGERHEPIAAE